MPGLGRCSSLDSPRSLPVSVSSSLVNAVFHTVGGHIVSQVNLTRLQPCGAPLPPLGRALPIRTTALQGNSFHLGLTPDRSTGPHPRFSMTKLKSLCSSLAIIDGNAFPGPDRGSGVATSPNLPRHRQRAHHHSVQPRLQSLLYMKITRSRRSPKDKTGQSPPGPRQVAAGSRACVHLT